MQTPNQASVTMRAKPARLALAVVAAAPVWSTAAFSIGLASLFFFWVLCGFWRNGAWRTPLAASALLLISALCAAALAAPDSSAAWDEVRTYYPLVLLVFAADIVRSRRELWWIARFFMVSAALGAAAATLQNVGWIQWHDSRFSGTVDIFQYAACMVFGWIICAWIYLRTKKLRLAAGALVLSLLFAEAIRLNASRASLVAISIALAVIAWSSRRQWRRLLIFFVPVLFSIPLVMNSELGNRLEHVNSELNLNQPTSQHQTLWAYAWTTFLDAPILGSGPGTFVRACATLQDDSRLADYAPLRAVHKHAHNIFLHFLATAGVIGFLGLLAWIGLTSWFFLRASIRGDDLAVLALALYLAFLAFSLTDMPILNSRISGLLFLALGACAGAIRGAEGSDHNPSEKGRTGRSL